MPLHHRQAVRLQKRKKGAVIGGILLGDQVMRHHRDLGKLLGGSQSRDILLRIFRVHHIL